ncbi:hypothetical protein Oter_4010 [Opitutus terrae PB90-1]|uniref:Uncharacterized protein n=1 Tax=Opitutus terrae (strain DSM 11246 / JCM 15787 / PB90-1) TaxID=452637 RepID=B1ZZU8_OPITP|nr:hypothetical protein Oter_4010 [Opitutus terrae PB90-1]
MENIRPIQPPAAPPVPQDSVRSLEQKKLQDQCLELNRQAIVPAPESKAGKDFREILDSIKP